MAQNAATDSTSIGVKIAVLPILYYTPETRLAFGAGGSIAFKMKSAKTISSLQLGAIYTLRKQLLTYLPFNLFIGPEDRFRFKGEAGYFNFIYEYYGIGSIPNEQALYTARFPRVRLAAFRKIGKDIYAGINWEFDDYKFPDLIIDEFNFSPETIGIEGGRMSVLGPGIQWDKRDSQYWTTNGHYLETGILFGGRVIGSEYNYGKWYLDYRHFFPLKKAQTIGWQLYKAISWGDVPFIQLPIIGGSKLLRGYYQGYLRDRSLFLVQAEYRRPLIWKLDMVMFMGIGTVSPNAEAIARNVFWPSYGAGLRYPLVEKAGINIRLDYAFGRGVSAFYLTFGEAF